MSDAEKKKTVFCPLEEDMVDVESCGHCGLWDGRGCCYGHGMEATGKAVRGYRSFFRRMFGPRIRFRRGGRRLIVPPVWEKWPYAQPEAEKPAVADDDTAYGTAGLLADEQQVMYEDEDAFVLPELIKEYWDEKPDVPDWISAEDKSRVVSEPGVPEGYQPEDLQPKPFPPVPGMEPGTGIPPIIPPDFPPQTPGPPLP